MAWLSSAIQDRALVGALLTLGPDVDILRAVKGRYDPYDRASGNSTHSPEKSADRHMPPRDNAALLRPATFNPG